MLDNKTIGQFKRVMDFNFENALIDVQVNSHAQAFENFSDLELILSFLSFKTTLTLRYKKKAIKHIYDNSQSKLLFYIDYSDLEISTLRYAISDVERERREIAILFLYRLNEKAKNLDVFFRYRYIYETYIEKGEGLKGAVMALENDIYGKVLKDFDAYDKFYEEILEEYKKIKRKSRLNVDLVKICNESNTNNVLMKYFGLKDVVCVAMIDMTSMTINNLSYGANKFSRIYGTPMGLYNLFPGIKRLIFKESSFNISSVIIDGDRIDAYRLYL